MTFFFIMKPPLGFAALKIELQRIQEGFEIHTYFLIYKFAQKNKT